MNFLLWNQNEEYTISGLEFYGDTVDSRYLELEGTLWNTSKYPYFDISDFQNWGKYKSHNQIWQMNM